MHQAPSVSYATGKSRWHLGSILLIWSLGHAAFLLLLHTQPWLEWKIVGLVCVSLAGVPALLAWKNVVPGVLRWDGQCWHWSGFLDTSPCHVDLVVDLQQVILLRLSAAPAQRTWLWLSADVAGFQWIALRRAVVGGQGRSGNGQKNPRRESSLES